MKTAISLILKTLCVLFISVNSYAQGSPCYATSNWTFDPPIPANGTYFAGTTVDICVEVMNYQSIGASWLHIMQLNFPEPWDISTLQSVNSPEACGNGGDWLFFSSLTCGLADGPGYFYDVNSGGPQDGNPCNNFGDPCFGSNAYWQFCVQITLGAPNIGNPQFEGADITPSLILIGDEASFPTGSSCGLTNVTSPDTPILFNSCDAYSGNSPGFLPICGSEPFCLFDTLEDNPDTGGTWSGPAGWTADACGTFDPISDPPGEYAYTVVGTDGCQFTSTINLGYNNLGTVPSSTYCQSAPVSLFNLLTSPVETTGAWYYPLSAGGGLVDGSIVNPLTDPAGLYTYNFINPNECATSISAEVRFTNEGRSGETTTVNYCPLDGDFCPFDLMGGAPDSGGGWILYNAEGTFLQFYPNSGFCLSPGQLQNIFGSTISDGFSVNYVIGNPPCAPSIDTLYVNYTSPVGDNCSTITGIVSIGANCGPRSAILQAFYPDASVPFETYEVMVDESGNFEVGISLPPNVSVSLKVSGYLSTRINNVTVVNGANTLDFGNPMAGDISGDNAVNIADISLMNGSFMATFGDANYNSNADLNCNGIVNLVDASLVNPAFGLIGE